MEKADLCASPNAVVYACLSRYIGQVLDKRGFTAMPRRVRESILDSRDARLKLKVRGKPYWRSIGAGLHVGYRKGRMPGGGLRASMSAAGSMSLRVSVMPTTSQMPIA